MKHGIIKLLVFLLSMVFLFSGYSFAANGQGSSQYDVKKSLQAQKKKVYKEGELLVKFKEGTTINNKRKIQNIWECF